MPTQIASTVAQLAAEESKVLFLKIDRKSHPEADPTKVTMEIPTFYTDLLLDKMPTGTDPTALRNLLNPMYDTKALCFVLSLPSTLLGPASEASTFVVSYKPDPSNPMLEYKFKLDVKNQSEVKKTGYSKSRDDIQFGTLIVVFDDPMPIGQILQRTVDHLKKCDLHTSVEEIFKNTKKTGRQYVVRFDTKIKDHVYDFAKNLVNLRHVQFGKQADFYLSQEYAAKYGVCSKCLRLNDREMWHDKNDCICPRKRKHQQSEASTSASFSTTVDF